jgi:nicotinate-nucleotide pyrophosphorylase (carboxylating)
MLLNAFMVRPFVERALAEEIGPGDTTGGFLLKGDEEADAQIYAKGSFVVAGLLLAEETFRMLDPEAILTREVEDGDRVEPGQVLLRIHARAWALFAGERTSLDFLQHLSAIATSTARYVEILKPYPRTRLTDTRKGVPGMRALQKYAVRVGGGWNHLFGLHNAVLIKDNHIKIAGGVREAIEKVRAQAQHTFKVEVEVESLEQVRQALDASAEIIMLDNMDLPTMQEAIQMIGDRAMVEVSGGITEEKLERYAKLGVDIISSGAITHTVKAVDISLDIGEIKPSAKRQIAEQRQTVGAR